MPSFRLKYGSYLCGSGTNRKKYNHAGPNNIVESDQNLAALHPEKFERLDPYNENYQYPDSPDYPAPNQVSEKSPAQMPSLTPTTAHQTDKTAKSLDERYGGLDALNVAELKQVAEAEEIPLPKNLTKKEEIIKELRKGK